VSTCFALWVNRDGSRDWDGPFAGNTPAREAVPVTATASVILTPVPMTPAEYREAMPIMEAGQ
jgi:hypothetical protein